ncbi:hypothetical protein N0V90_004591 [Kalmusia sp. IMI 367209]|nr:hypothetical protein N0V90_004591 [Kalmusia sp. IMI 367209]
MAAGQEPTPAVEDDPATASDALSLHTIAEGEVYAAQEQEDADFALALALEEQESQRYARTQRILQGQDPNQINSQLPARNETFTPYRDDPDALATSEEEHENPPPYRDDPDAAPVEGEDAQGIADPAKRQRAFVRILRKLFKTWLCCLMISTIVTIVIIVVVIALVFIYGTKVDAKEAAWKASGSQDYNLKLHKLYPALEDGANDACKTSWEKHGAGIPCHRMLLSSAWDNGDVDQVNADGADPFMYNEAVCTNQCRASIRQLATPLVNSCRNRTDRFDFVSYGNNGKAYFEKGKIEEGPVHVTRNLMERYDRLCAPPPRRQSKTEWNTCAADLWMKWGIVDGKNEAHMNGLAQFMAQTSEKKTIPSERRAVSSLSSTGQDRTYIVTVPSREVGPGAGETDCGFCTLDWLERKTSSFEFGQILNPATGEALGLSEFRTKMFAAMNRCKGDYAALVQKRVTRKWTEFGWWCEDKPCNIDKPEFSEETKAILHGWNENYHALQGLRNIMNNKDAPKKALQVLHDGIRDMPCGIGFTQTVATHEVIPYEHMIKRLCSDQCRNALDRFQQQHGSLFAGLVDNPHYGHFFQYPAMAVERMDQICLSSNPGAIMQSSVDLCAPGYAAVGRPDWIFASSPPSHGEVLSAFAQAIDKIAAKLPEYVKRPKTDEESARIMAKKLSESACNTCAGNIFIGSGPDWKKTVDEYLDDKSVNGTEYVAAAKKGWLTCGKMYGKNLSEREKRIMWRRYGLDRFD